MKSEDILTELKELSEKNVITSKDLMEILKTIFEAKNSEIIKAIVLSKVII